MSNERVIGNICQENFPRSDTRFLPGARINKGRRQKPRVVDKVSKRRAYFLSFVPPENMPSARRDGNKVNGFGILATEK